MTDTTPQVVRSYLSQLDAALADVPETVRAEIVEGVREELTGLDAATAARRIEELGDPAFIAAEARAETGTAVAAAAPKAVTESTGYVIVAGLLVAFGGILLPVVGWVGGIAMTWFSGAWWRWEKWVATLLAPGVVGLSLAVTFGINALSGGPGSANPIVPSHFDLLTMAFLLPWGLNVVVGLWLLWRTRRDPRP